MNVRMMNCVESYTQKATTYDILLPQGTIILITHYYYKVL